MSAPTLLNPLALLLLFILFPVWLLMRREQYRRNLARKQLGGAASTPRSAWESGRTWFMRVLLAITFIVIGLSRPAHSPMPQAIRKGGRDIIFAIDVSRSMLATDTKPSRLEKAKNDIRSCVAHNPGARVGLIAFAGTAVIKVPLTLDHDFLMQALDALSPGSVSHGSTFFQAVFEKTGDRLLSEARKGMQDLLLLTDGEDHGSHPEKALAAIASNRTRLLVIGYGDSTIGARIPVAGEKDETYLMDEGFEVWTRLEESRLQSFANACDDGRYVRGSRGDFLLSEVYRAWAAEAPQQPIDIAGDLVYQELFPLFVFLAALLLLPLPFRIRPAITSVIILCSIIYASHAEDSASDSDWLLHFNEAQQLMAKNNFTEALEIFGVLSDSAYSTDHRAASAYESSRCYAELSDLSGTGEEKYGFALEGINLSCRALLFQPRWKDAQRLLEGLVMRRNAAQKQMQQEQAEQQKMDDLLQKIITALRELIKEQQQLVKDGIALIPPRRHKNQQKPPPSALPENFLPRQKSTMDKTAGVLTQLRDFNAVIKKSFQQADNIASDIDIPTEFDKPIKFVEQGHSEQQKSIPAFKATPSRAAGSESQKRAVAALKSALDALEKDQNSGEDGQDFSDDEWDEDADWEMSDAEQGTPSSLDMQSSAMRSDFVNKTLPTPDYSVEELLNEEADNNMLRESKRAAQSGSVKKDW